MKVVLDTNIVISAIVFGGLPEQILKKVRQKEIIAVSSLSLIAELIDILSKKFGFPKNKLKLIEKKIKKISMIVYPDKTINVLEDEPDNRVLEAGLEGEAEYIVTGDKDLLRFGEYKGIKIVTAKIFFDII
ncbi:MAG: hypothetical protein UU37_C0002G0063 [Candidatus Gottesmanbacteria bacterium GW2011_GWA2_41_12]|uniref:PIN domain-containing protein n=2 Tax=Candidatus Gottesmaniibacteriota TaxID=1752720 RepID=A0A0G0UI97_9BACT|nr:MAG: hypothetical protein UT63_C0072G0003 [Candidatus Gottesmanbacteria bacterium GW2011_GWC2_39_8]KKR88548.1 MAG: hypothetical protein UU37_C0002G0063 [Candidatus Gottesmanbacteria bacterium GW2011_GWA2_41_12]